jgi:hypothetical protein
MGSEGVFGHGETWRRDAGAGGLDAPRLRGLYAAREGVGWGAEGIGEAPGLRRLWHRPFRCRFWSWDGDGDGSLCFRR